jgi:formylglycine-generating enzyme required for sulfatase activity
MKVMKTIFNFILHPVLLLTVFTKCMPASSNQTAPNNGETLSGLITDAQYDARFIFDYPLVSVKGGTFTMGCTNGQQGYDADECPHTATVSDFQIGRFEVTQTQWISVMGDNPSGFSTCPDCPVEHISWYDAKKFIHKLNTMTGRAYRLPTETEWEYAARGGQFADSKANFIYAGVQHANLKKAAWFNDNSAKKTHPVGSKAPNTLGLYDMSGNVHEWCEDLLKPYEHCTANPDIEAKRVGRGGSWNSTYFACRVSDRMGVQASNRYLNLGLRLVHD